MRCLLALTAAFALSACTTPAPAPTQATAATAADIAECPADASGMDGWDTAAPPRRVYGNTWYVGTCGISALLVTSDQGHVLVDAGTAKAAPLVEASIRALGFRLEDIKYILNSHDHHDHAGGLAQLQADSGAIVLAGADSVATLLRGASDASDPQYHTTASFPPVARVQAVADGQTISVGPLRITAHATPGHTAGGTSWSWSSCQDGQCRHIVYADSVSAISDDHYRYSDESAHPGTVAAFRRSLDTLDGLDCDILISTHPVASQLWARLGNPPSAALIQPDACHVYAANGRKGLQARLQQEQNEAQP
ncbi:subclass B3 metallo-beta-lactamase [Pseudoxanthomonas dokdonensis]|uniref:Metallo-beta-lactamase domain-containing protein n=1 Tax=Pseudoxanthomonas dokdonensis TaxID=344882 RepID=A0A0R0CXV2_9GAMM|nr:subclass B3 metallo-beta-lactamase [Pseudoxanthomonas dokdonensis]KRG70657.1 hypothetical protein ABB29_06260 [Pseudoxanthomonas dokdonensis]